MKLDAEIAAFVKERDAALRTLDPETCWAFALKHNQEMRTARAPLDPSVKAAMMHKARCSVLTFTEEEKAVSLDWLTANGYKVPAP